MDHHIPKYHNTLKGPEKCKLQIMKQVAQSQYFSALNGATALLQ